MLYEMLSMLYNMITVRVISGVFQFFDVFYFIIIFYSMPVFCFSIVFYISGTFLLDNYYSNRTC